MVDALVEQVVTAQDREKLTIAAHALDRVLLWRWYLVPNWDSRVFHIAYWDRFGCPDKPIRAGIISTRGGWIRQRWRQTTSQGSSERHAAPRLGGAGSVGGGVGPT